MGLEGEHFLGNPNKVEHSSDELEYDSGDEGGIGGGGFWLASIEDSEIDDINGDPVYNMFHGEVEIEDDDDFDDDNDDDYLDTEDDDESVDDHDYDIVDDRDINLDFFFDSGEDDANDDDDGELRLRVVNGQYVQACPIVKSTSEPVEGASGSNVNSENTTPETAIVKDASAS